MADLTKTVSIIFAGKDELSVTTRKLYGELGDFGGAVKGLSGSLSSLADGILKVDAAMNALVVGGLLYAIKTAGDFSGKFGEISTLITDTGKPVEEFKKQILDYSTSSVKSIDDINKSVYAAISAGVDYKDSLKFINTAEQLAVAGRADLESTTKVLISTLNAYGESTDKATKYSDIMFNTVRLGQTTLPELSASLAQVTGLASSGGVSFETLSAAIAALTVSGLPTALAITGIKEALNNILKPASQAEKMASSLGIQFNASALQTKGFEGVLKDVYTATHGDIGKIAELFGSVEALNSVMILGADKSGKFKEALTAMGSAAGATKTAYDKVAGEFENINTRISNTFKVVLIDIGEKFLPKYGEAATALGDVFKGVKTAIDAGTFDPVLKAIDSFATQAIAYMSAVAKNLPEALKRIDFTGLVKSFDNLGTALGGLFQAVFGEMDLTTVEGLRTMIQKLVDVFASLNNITAGIIDGMKPLFRIIGEGINQFSDISAGTAEFVGNVIGMAKAFYITTTYLQPMSDIFTVLASSFYIAPQIVTLVSALKSMEISMISLNAVMTASPLALGAFAISAGIAAGALAQYIPGVKEAGEGMGAWVYDLFHADEGQKALAATTIGTARTVKEFGDIVKALPAESTTAIKLAEFDKSIADITTVKKGVDSLPDKKSVDVAVKLPTKSVVDESKVIQNAIEWVAKIDIAQIESAAKMIESAFKSVDNTISETGKTITGLSGDYSKLLQSGGDSMVLNSAIDREISMQQDATKKQGDLIDAQISLLKTKASKLEKGESLITITADGLEPELETILWKVIRKVNIRANEEAAEFLLGLPTT
jgi:TP901 family phage tail tape measure protein